MFPESIFKSFGTTRWVEDIFAIPGGLIFNEQSQLLEIKLNRQHPYTEAVAEGLEHFLRFSSNIRYRIKVSPFRSEIQATDILFDGVPIEKLIDRSFSIVCTTFFRVLARRWEGQNEMAEWSKLRGDF